jgi:hypothetical protein
MIKRPATDGDAERVHGGEVGGSQIARLMNLAKDDRLARSVGSAPLPHTTLESAAMRIQEPARVHLPEPVEEHFGTQAWFGPQSVFNLGPDIGKRVNARTVGTRGALLFANARKRFLVAIVSSRLGTHARSPCRHGQGHSQADVAIQTPNLAIRNHRIPPKRWELRLWPDVQKEGILIVAGWGNVIVARHCPHD